MQHHDLPFVHRFHIPENTDGTTIVLLHGTGGSETDLMPFARDFAPKARLLGVRGRNNEEGVQRWFRRTSATSFDQPDIIREAKAFATFMIEAINIYELDPDKITYLGYSNGANLLGALMPLQPHLIRRAILLRAIAVLDKPPAADLSDASVLIISGKHDPYRRLAPALEKALTEGGASLDTRLIDAGHELSQQDLELAHNWFMSTV